MMEQVRLINTDLTVSRIGMGSTNFGAPVLPQSQVEDHIDAFLDLGGNLIDTAHVYSDWIPGETSRSEKAIGRWIARHKRSSVVLCTKGGHSDLADWSVSRVTPDALRTDLRESLDYLQTDYVDIYMLHRDNPALCVDVIMDCLAGFVAEGRVKYLACSNWTVERHRQANEYAAAHGMPGFVVNELMWSMAKPNAAALPSDYVLMDEDMLEFGKNEKISFFCFSSLAKGYFTHRYQGLAVHDENVYTNAENEALMADLGKLPSAAAVTQACLRFFVRPDVTAVPLVSFSNMNQLMECCGAFII